MMIEELKKIKAKRDRLHMALEENCTSINVIIDAMYSDSETHFIWELLQNGDDAGAKHLRLDANEDTKCIILEHDGRPFTARDIDGISNIGASTKKKSTQKTGKFGVGFKSVFSFCQTVEIYNGDVAIELTNRLSFEILEKREEVPHEKTVFVFKGVDRPQGLINDVFEQLNGRQDAFMYLKNIQQIIMCGKVFQTKDIYNTFYTVKTDNLSFSFKEGIRGSFYCLFPLKHETGIPVHINAPFDVTAARDDFRGKSEYNNALMQEYEQNFINVLHQAKEYISVDNMIEIILKADERYELKKEKLINVEGTFYMWLELVQDQSQEKIFEKFPFFFEKYNIKRCADIDGLMEVTEKDIEEIITPLNLHINNEMALKYLDFIRFVISSDQKRVYLSQRIFVSDCGEVRHGDYCEFFLLSEGKTLHENRRRPLHSMFRGDGIYTYLSELNVNNDARIYSVYQKVVENETMCVEDIQDLNVIEKQVLKKELRKVPLFNGLCADQVWVANTLLYILNPDKAFVRQSFLTDFLEVVSSLEELIDAKHELTLDKVIHILTCGDDHRMLIMLDFLKDNLKALSFLKNAHGNILDISKVNAFFGLLYRDHEIVFDKSGNQRKLSEVTRRTIEPDFLEAYQMIPNIPDIKTYLGINIEDEDSIWGYGDGEQESEYTRGLDPRQIGEKGEEFAYEQLKSIYPEHDIVHINSGNETGEHYDILIDGIIKVEVKTRKSDFSHAKRGVKLSRLQIEECIRSDTNNFWLAIVNLDMQKMKLFKRQELFRVALNRTAFGPDIFEG